MRHEEELPILATLMKQSPLPASHLGPAISTPPGTRMLAEMLDAAGFNPGNGLIDTGAACGTPCPRVTDL